MVWNFLSYSIIIWDMSVGNCNLRSSISFCFSLMPHFKCWSLKKSSRWSNCGRWIRHIKSGNKPWNCVIVHITPMETKNCVNVNKRHSSSENGNGNKLKVFKSPTQDGIMIINESQITKHLGSNQTIKSYKVSLEFECEYIYRYRYWLFLKLRMNAATTATSGMSMIDCRSNLSPAKGTAIP